MTVYTGITPEVSLNAFHGSVAAATVFPRNLIGSIAGNAMSCPVSVAA